MNRILLIILFSSIYCFSQNENNFKNKKSTLDYLENIFCNKPFSILINEGLSFKVKIKSNRNKFYLEYIKGDNIQEIICNDDIILKIDHKYEEIEIYSLTKKEQKECFFISKFMKEFEIKNIDELNALKKIEGVIKKLNLNIGLIVPVNFQENQTKNSKEKEILNYTISENKKNKNIYQKIIFHEEKKFNEKFNDDFSMEKISIKVIKEKFNDWEIIDFR